jgi:type II secretory pathway predicted ATPase ExeA
MFLEHYGLREQPFGVTPDPRYLYFSAMHREALASLFYGIETGCGFLSLIAPPGMGKTTLLLHLLERLRKSARTVFLFQTQCDSREFFRYLLTDLGVDASDQNMAHMHESLNFVLLNNARMGRRFVLIIDEAQNLKKTVLETVRLLSDFETADSKLLQIVLCGQPQLADKLSHPDLMQLRQRISIFSRLQPFDKAEVVNYIHHRLKVAGHPGHTLFSSNAIDQIVAHSDGIPRIINNVCFNALTLGYAKRQEQIDGSTVSEVLADLDTDLLRSQSVPPAPARISHDWCSSLSLEPAHEVRQDSYSVTRGAWIGGEALTTDEQAETSSLSLTSGADGNPPSPASRRDASDLAVPGLPSVQDVTVTDLASVRILSTDAPVPRVPDQAEMKVEHPRKVEPRRRDSATVLRPGLDEFPSKYKMQAREWLAEPPILAPSSNAIGSDPTVLPVTDLTQVTDSSEAAHDEFCGLLMSNLRQTIKNQSLFDESQESQEQLEGDVLEISADTVDISKMDIAGQTSAPALSDTKGSHPLQNEKKSDASGSTTQTPSESRPEPVPDGAHESQRQNDWKLIDTYRRAAYSWDKRRPTLPPRIGR